MRPDLALTFPAPVGVQKNPRFLRKFQICGLITLLLDIGSLARGAKIHSHPQILTKKWPKNDEKRAILGVFPGGVKKGHFWGGGLSPRGGQKGGFCLSNLHSFWPKRQIWSKKGHFLEFWLIFGVFVFGFWGV